MTVSQLKAILEALEKSDAGDYQVRFRCEEKLETGMNGSGVVVLPSRTFDFSDNKYEFRSNSYLTNNGMYPCKTTICTDNIEVVPSDKTVTFRQF